MAVEEYVAAEDTKVDMAGSTSLVTIRDWMLKLFEEEEFCAGNVSVSATAVAGDDDGGGWAEKDEGPVAEEILEAAADADDDEGLGFVKVWPGRSIL